MEDTRLRPDLTSRSVEELSRSCINTFGRLLKSEIDGDLLENALADFRLWADGVGALARSAASLDFRLKERPDDLWLVKSILAVLLSFLDKLAEMNAGRNENNDHGSRCRHDVLWSIDSSLKNLSLIGVAIRRTGKASRTRRAQENFNPADHSDFRKHLECIVLLRPSKDGLDARDLDSSKLTDLQTRLIEANLRRRHCFLAAQKHSLSLKDHPRRSENALEDLNAIPTTETPQSPIPQVKPHSAVQEEKSKDAPTQPPPPSTTALQSKASTAKGPLRYNPANVTHEIAQTQITAIAADAELPRPPNFSSGRQLFECPCCCQSIPVTQKWREHLIEDLRPYTCVAADCPTPDSLFTTRNEWETHMTQDHLPEWICPLCEDASLDSMERTTEHVRTLHKEEMNDFGLSSVVSWCAVRTYGITSCPLCSSKGPQDEPELVDHVLSHAYDFALRSLPWTQSASEDPNRPVGTYTLPQNLHDPDRFLEWVQGSPIIHDSGLHGDWTPARPLYTEELSYFAHHDYFDQRSMDDCSRDKGARSSGSPSLSRWTNKTSIQQSASHSIDLSDHEETRDNISSEGDDSGGDHDSNEGDDSVGDDDSGESDDSGEDLAECLAREVQQSRFDRKEFWPCGCLNDIITPKRVHKWLNSASRVSYTEASPGEQDVFERLVDFISKRSKKAFAISLQIGLSNKRIRQAMINFQELGFDDHILPLIGDAATRIFFSSTTKGYRRPWNHFRVDAFCSNQWKFLAPVFDSTKSDLTLHTNHILPFTWAIQRGAGMIFGEVHEVTIHPAHRKNVVHNSNVAVKRLQHTNTEDQNTTQELEDEWRKEVQAYQEITKCGHSNIIRFITAITREHDRYLLFEWADGGNLREFWLHHNHRLTRALIKDVMLQIRGLADALEAIHLRGYRHGDMKPENILRVKTLGRDPSKLDVGTLKICDMGLTKYHYLATQLRETATNAKFTTWRYEPPESTDKNKFWSRGYDIWSIGCIILEFIVWMVYGPLKLDEFNQRIVNEFGKQIHYFEFVKQNGEKVFRVHAAVSAMMDRLAQHTECTAGKTALGDLLRVVRMKLLVVALEPPNDGKGKTHVSANTQIQSRADSKTLKKELDDIIERGKNNSLYWLQGDNTDDSLSLRTPEETTAEPDLQDVLTVTSEISSVEAVELGKVWEFPVDNEFASNVVNIIGTDVLRPKATKSNDFCVKCRELEFWVPHFEIVDTWEELESSQHTCDFCKMRWETCSHLDREEFPRLRFSRDQSMLQLNGMYPPVLSIRRGREPQNSRASNIQIGYPLLPDSTSQAQFKILRKCLIDCNTDHPECRPQRLGPLPTRLIHVGSDDSDTINLRETQTEDQFEYIALSHPWGEGPHFCTTLANVQAYRTKIDFKELPTMFQHAVVTTRELGLEYLWIDSICIIQGEGGDFHREAKRMEDVFSSAFCVIGASSAQGQHDGFLNRRRQNREYLTFEHPGLPPLYVSRFMDDFNKDVLESPLSKRGWVLQERALARRTIYFTDNQTYWECGRGVRSEMLTKMDNKLASFLGDPNFPSKLSNDATIRGVKIRLYEDLYRQYTRLQFTRISDRPIAIAGLEKRLVRDLQAQGGFGVFDDGRSLFQRSLLWQRGREVPPMARIPSVPSLPVPTWSWMGYDGGIDFVDLPLGGVQWSTDAIQSPWATEGPDTWHTGDGKEFVELKARARPFELRSTGLAAPDEIEIVCDSQDWLDLERKDLMCVVVGREKKSNFDIEEMAHFVLVITRSEEPLMSKEGNTVCERIGVGHVKGKYLDLKSSLEAVVIR